MKALKKTLAGLQLFAYYTADRMIWRIVFKRSFEVTKSGPAAFACVGPKE